MKIEDIAKSLGAQVKAVVDAQQKELLEQFEIISSLAKRVKDLESRPEPKDGIDGKDAPAADLTPVYELISGRTEAIKNVQERLADLEGRPVPRDGRDGIQGQKGDTGERGYDGRDGADGWSPDHVEMTIDDEGQWEFKMVTGDKVKSFTGRIPVNVDRGVFSNEASYAKGHMVTYGGDVWVCKEDNPGPPGKDFAGWRLAVRKGRDAPRAKV